MSSTRILGLAAAAALTTMLAVPSAAQAAADDPPVQPFYVCDSDSDKTDGDSGGVSGWVENRYANEDARLTFRAHGEHLTLRNDSPNAVEGYLKRDSDGKYLGAVYAGPYESESNNLSLAEGTRAYLKILKAPGDWECYEFGVIT